MRDSHGIAHTCRPINLTAEQLAELAERDDQREHADVYPLPTRSPVIG